MRKSRKPWSAKTARNNAILWTLVAAVSILSLLLGVQNAFHVLVVIVFTLTAVLDWITYAQKRKAETSHGEKENS